MGWREDTSGEPFWHDDPRHDWVDDAESDDNLLAPDSPLFVYDVEDEEFDPDQHCVTCKSEICYHCGRCWNSTCQANALLLDASLPFDSLGPPAGDDLHEANYHLLGFCEDCGDFTCIYCDEDDLHCDRCEVEGNNLASLCSRCAQQRPPKDFETRRVIKRIDVSRPTAEKLQTIKAYRLAIKELQQQVDQLRDEVVAEMEGKETDGLLYDVTVFRFRVLKRRTFARKEFEAAHPGVLDPYMFVKEIPVLYTDVLF
jgi:hypothetical protein